MKLTRLFLLMLLAFCFACADSAVSTHEPCEQKLTARQSLEELNMRLNWLFTLTDQRLNKVENRLHQSVDVSDDQQHKIAQEKDRNASVKKLSQEVVELIEPFVTAIDDLSMELNDHFDKSQDPLKDYACYVDLVDWCSCCLEGMLFPQGWIHAYNKEAVQLSHAPYIALEGDTLINIATETLQRSHLTDPIELKHSLSQYVDGIMTINHLIDHTHIEAGQRIWLPYLHKIRLHDNLTSLAKMYATDTSQIVVLGQEQEWRSDNLVMILPKKTAKVELDPCTFPQSNELIDTSQATNDAFCELDRLLNWLQHYHNEQSAQTDSLPKSEKTRRLAHDLQSNAQSVDNIQKIKNSISQFNEKLSELHFVLNGEVNPEPSSKIKPLMGLYRWLDDFLVNCIMPLNYRQAFDATYERDITKNPSSARSKLENLKSCLDWLFEYNRQVLNATESQCNGRSIDQKQLLENARNQNAYVKIGARRTVQLIEQLAEVINGLNDTMTGACEKSKNPLDKYACYIDLVDWCACCFEMMLFPKGWIHHYEETNQDQINKNFYKTTKGEELNKIAQYSFTQCEVGGQDEPEESLELLQYIDGIAIINTLANRRCFEKSQTIQLPPLFRIRLGDSVENYAKMYAIDPRQVVVLGKSDHLRVGKLIMILYPDPLNKPSQTESMQSIFSANIAEPDLHGLVKAKFESLYYELDHYIKYRNDQAELDEKVLKKLADDSEDHISRAKELLKSKEKNAKLKDDVKQLKDVLTQLCNQVNALFAVVYHSRNLDGSCVGTKGLIQLYDWLFDLFDDGILSRDWWL